MRNLVFYPQREKYSVVFFWQLTYQALNVKAEISAPKVGVCSIPVKHDLSNTLIYQLVVLRPAGRRDGQIYSGNN